MAPSAQAEVRMILEVIGYVGSVLIGLSLTMSNIRKLRWINLFGAATFAVYGILISAWPVLILNGFIVGVDAWHLYRMNRQNEFYSLLAVSSQPSAYLLRFLDFHRDEIKSIFPDFEGPTDTLEGWWILQDMQPAGIFLFERLQPDTGHVNLDFVAPPFRNMKCAHWFFGEGLGHLSALGIRTLSAHSTSAAHQRYLRKVGFDEIQPNRFHLSI